jgi:hypothetical protein
VNGINALTKKAPGSCLASATGRMQQEGVIYELGSRSSPDTKSALILDFPDAFLLILFCGSLED